MSRGTAEHGTAAMPSTTIAERYFPLLSSSVIAAFAGLGLFLTTITAPPEPMAPGPAGVRTQFLVQEKLRPAPPPKPIAPIKKEAEPIDLSNKPLMDQEKNEAAVPPSTPAQPVRRVYGLRKVYSVGLGAGGNLSDAVIGKLGNTLATDFDTVTATDAELRGQVVSMTMITRAPRFRKVVKPRYTQEMIDNKLEGVVRVRVLVDIDGKVKKALALNDIGFGAAQEAMKACLLLEFEPAMQGEDPKAVWIIVPIRFELLG